MNGLVAIKRRLQHAICHPLVGRLLDTIYDGRIASRGCVLDTRAPGVVPALQASLFWGLYERAEVLSVRRHLRRDLDAVELGSGIGVVSCQIARRLAPDNQLICVEANPDLMPVLRRNVLHNAPATRVHFVGGAVDYSGQAVVTLAAETRSLDGRISAAGGCGVNVPAHELREILDRFGLQEFTLVSDIEGSEAAMFRCDDALDRCRQVIAELHDTVTPERPASAGRSADALLARGFRLTHRRGHVFVFEREPAPVHAR